MARPALDEAFHSGSARGKCEEFQSHLPRGIRSVGGGQAKAQARTRLLSRVPSRASSGVSLPWERSFWFPPAHPATNFVFFFGFDF